MHLHAIVGKGNGSLYQIHFVASVGVRTVFLICFIDLKLCEALGHKEEFLMLGYILAYLKSLYQLHWFILSNYM
jgi:hypothetical protein